jgi:hypothetical protein
MKRMSLTVAAVGLVVLLGIALAQEVTSVNMVGFNKITVPGGKLVLVSTAFESIDGTALKATDVFGDQLPNGTAVHAFDVQAGSYVTDNKGFSGWSENVTFAGGMGFWIQAPAGGDYEVTFKGQVPMAEATTNLVANGITLLGYPYTASVMWTNTALAKTAVNGDSIHIFNPDTGSYVTYNKGFAGWGAGDALTLSMDLGFWFETAQTSFQNVEIRPYNP